jgi:asparagine synthase (glutamine-hydrolysing)
MINIELQNNNGYQWHSLGQSYVKGYIITPDNRILKNRELLEYFHSSQTYSQFHNKAGKACGLFSAVITKNNELWATIDHTRAFPLFYHTRGADIHITDNIDSLQAHSIPFILDKESAIFLASSGFTPGDRTLLQNILQIQAGESLQFHSSTLTKQFHTTFLTEKYSAGTRQEHKTQLGAILDQTASRMIATLDGRPAAIPLSGGYDSRMIAWMLKKHNYNNVICYTFGESHSIEKHNAQQTARQLGYKYIFIDYEKYSNTPLSRDPHFNRYVQFSSNYSAVFSEQQYYAIRELVEQHKIPSNTIFIPGHSGAVAGDLLAGGMNRSNYPYTQHILSTVCSYIYLTRQETATILSQLPQFSKTGSHYQPYATYENWRFRETTTKFGYHDAKIFDFFNFQYLLPLADKALYEFFSHIPFEHKIDKNLYREYLAGQFDQYSINFKNHELHPTPATQLRVAISARLKTLFPILRLLINIHKNDTLGSRRYSSSFAEDLRASRIRRKKLSVNGIFSEWYLMKVKQQIQTK